MCAVGQDVGCKLRQIFLFKIAERQLAHVLRYAHTFFGGRLCPRYVGVAVFKEVRQIDNRHGHNGYADQNP
ncbi:hypothetical protein SDC9_65984 [bioreactor metagenome]|uniref:Uncharacterized protein n=1 Tax=bioreactor metagenome TaxID=1076179 RepID=A0A644XUW5_9ZZZZ